VDPNAFVMANADAVLFLNYKTTPDHGSALPGFNFYMEPVVFAQLLSGKVEPTGMIVKEIARDPYIDGLQWKDLAGDQGASPYVRLLVQALMMADTENHASPNNFGDPLVIYNYSMRYGKAGDFKYSCLILPQSVAVEEGTNSWGSPTVTTTVTNQAKAGEPFSVYCLLRNNGGDDLTMVQAKADGEVVAEKLYTVQGGSWRVVEIQLTLEAGEHEIEIGGLTGTLTVGE
jgi:hypothetical protein